MSLYYYYSHNNSIRQGVSENIFSFFGGQAVSAETWDLIRIGYVAAVDYATARVRVTFEQLGFTSDWIPVLQRGCVGRADYWLPDIGERVACAFNSDGTEHGVVLGSYYPISEPPPDNGKGKYFAIFPDGSKVKWDAGALSIIAKDGIVIAADITATGTISVTGDLTVHGIVKAHSFVEVQG